MVSIGIQCGIQDLDESQVKEHLQTRVSSASKSSSSRSKQPTPAARRQIAKNTDALRRSRRIAEQPLRARTATAKPVIRKVTSVRSGDFNAVVEYLKKEHVQVRRNKMPILTATQKAHAFHLIRSNVKDGKKIKDGDMDDYLQRAINSSLVTKYYGKAGTRKKQQR